MALILLLAAVVLVGSVISQAPPSIIADHAAYGRWLGRARGTYGGWTDTFDRLQLFNVFHSLIFRALLGLLVASILACTMSRWRGIWNTAFHTRVRVSEGFLLRARFHARLETPLSTSEASERLRRSFKGAGYGLRTDSGSGSVALFADKNRLSRFGTFFTHLGIVLILGGAIVGGVWGFADPQFNVAEGSTRDLGLGTGISVQLNHFSADYYPDGRPKDYSSDITLFKAGKPVKQGTIQVNSPMRYDGVAFHQTSFGQSAVVRVQDASGKVLFDGGVPLALQTADGQRPVGTLDLPDLGTSVYFTGARSGLPDSTIAAGELRVELYQDYIRAVQPANLAQGVPRELAGLTFTFERETWFTGLKVVKNPGTTIIWVACAFMLGGLIMLFYLPRRRLWALCKERPDGNTEVLVAMPGQRDQMLDDEFERLRDRAERALNGAPTEALRKGGHNG
jgi:cytochrome c biogenesis protein